jgi:hypothetical protein
MYAMFLEIRFYADAKVYVLIQSFYQLDFALKELHRNCGKLRSNKQIKLTYFPAKSEREYSTSWNSRDLLT